MPIRAGGVSQSPMDQRTRARPLGKRPGPAPGCLTHQGGYTNTATRPARCHRSRAAANAGLGPDPLCPRRRTPLEKFRRLVRSASHCRIHEQATTSATGPRRSSTAAPKLWPTRAAAAARWPRGRRSTSRAERLSNRSRWVLGGCESGGRRRRCRDAVLRASAQVGHRRVAQRSSAAFDVTACSFRRWCARFRLAQRTSREPRQPPRSSRAARNCSTETT
jgi:hypothetical protein